MFRDCDVIDEVPQPARTPNEPQPLVFGLEARPLFGFYHAPADRPGHALGVVLCNPLGYEAMCTHRSYRVLAQRLAERGFHALRFDYDGTGDSAGRLDDAGRLKAWTESIHTAVVELRRRSGVRHVTLFGVRFGATMAALAAATRDDIHSLALWAPLDSGRAYVREMRAFRMIKDPKVAAIPRTDGAEEIAGYLFGAETLAAMTSVNLLTEKGRLATRVLVIPRDDVPGTETRLAAHLAATGSEVDIEREPGYALMMRDAQESVVPSKALDSVVAWLEQELPENATIGPREPAPALSLASTGFRESPLFFESSRSGRRVFGIVTEPAGGAPRSQAPIMLFLNVGANHHVGPNRMYVILARELAARGYVSLRFDVAGLGDSPLPPGSPDNRLYSKDSVEDVKGAMTFLQKQRGADRFILAGLCSGAYLAFHTAVEDPRVVGQVLLNPQTFEWREGDSLELSVRKGFLSTRYYAKALLDYRTWLRAARGEVNVRGVIGELRDRLHGRAGSNLAALGARLAGRPVARSEIERAFHKLSDRSVESLLVFSFNDGGLDMIETHLGASARRMRHRKNFRLEIIDGADHTFTPVPSQQVLYELVERHILARFA